MNDSAFANNADRVVNRDMLKMALERALADHECAAIAETLIQSGVPCGAVRNVAEVARDPHTLHREMVVDANGHRGTGSPIKLGQTPVSYRRAPPAFAAHTAEVLGELGIDLDAYKDVLPDAIQTGRTPPKAAQDLQKDKK